MKAIELVQRAMTLGSRLQDARSKGLLRGDVLFVRVVRVTSTVARGLGQVPPKNVPKPTERVALTLAAAQLRHMGGMLAPRGDADENPDTPEGALAELVAVTLDLVDKLLSYDPEMTSGTSANSERRALPERGAAESSPECSNDNDERAGGGPT